MTERDCFYRRIEPADSEETFMAALPDGIVAEMEEIGKLDDVSDELLTDAEVEQGRELMTRPLCAEAGCPVNNESLARLSLAIMGRNNGAVVRLKDEALDGCDIKQI